MAVSQHIGRSDSRQEGRPAPREDLLGSSGVSHHFSWIDHLHIIAAMTGQAEPAMELEMGKGTMPTQYRLHGPLSRR